MNYTEFEQAMNSNNQLTLANMARSIPLFDKQGFVWTTSLLAIRSNGQKFLILELSNLLIQLYVSSSTTLQIELHP